MSLNSPNIVFLTIDSLRYDRLACNGYDAGHTPTLDRLCKDGISFKNYFGHGSPTQFAFPPIFASTYPLDEGGYGSGIKLRGGSFVEVLQAAGYWTVGLSTGGALTECSGYNRGFAHYHHLNEISAPLTHVWKNEISFYRKLYDRGQMTLDVVVAKIARSVEEALQSTLSACTEKSDEKASGSIATHPDFHGADLQRVAQYMSEELTLLRASPRDYVRRLVAAGDMTEAYPLLPLPLLSRGKIAGQIYNYVSKALSYLDVTLRFGRRKTMGVKYVFDSFERYIGRAKGRKFFIWAHVMDIHDLSYGDSKVEFPPLASPTFRKIVRMGSHYRGLRRYDYAVSHVDRYVGKLLAQLREHRLDRNTLLVVTSDHGIAANWPRPSASHVGSFYDEHCRLPLVFHHPDLPSRSVNGMFGSVDLSVTLLGLLGLRPLPSFRGIDALAEGTPSRPYILMENLGRGPHDLEHKAIRLSVRTTDRKYIMDDDDGECQVREVYALDSDPDELINMIDSPAEAAGVQHARLLGAQRCAEVRGRSRRSAPPLNSPNPDI